MIALDDDGHEISCPECGGEGFIEADCDEDTCCCTEPHELIPCPICTPRITPVRIGLDAATARKMADILVEHAEG